MGMTPIRPRAAFSFFFFFSPLKTRFLCFLYSLYIPGWHGTRASRVLGLKVCTTMAWQVQGFSRIACQHHLCFETQGKLFETGFIWVISLGVLEFAL